MVFYIVPDNDAEKTPLGDTQDHAASLQNMRRHLHRSRKNKKAFR